MLCPLVGVGAVCLLSLFLAIRDVGATPGAPNVCLRFRLRRAVRVVRAQF